MSAQTFRDRIRPLSERSRARTPRRTGASRALESIRLRERAAAEIQVFIEPLMEVVPSLEMSRRTYDGSWVLGVSADEPRGKWRGKPYRAFSRLDFFIDVDLGSGALWVTCHSTTFDRDGDAARFETSTDEPAWDDLKVFAETQSLLFAQRYFEDRRGDS